MSKCDLSNLLTRLIFNLWYLRRPPWDSGISPPELLEFIQTHPPGRALDLGCGSGTSSITLARAGWQVTGVDFASRAIKNAIQKAKTAGVRVDFRLDDVTSLRGVAGSFDLILDIGCFHSLSPDQQARYLDHLTRLLSQGGTWLLYGFFKPDPDAGGPGFTEDAIRRAAERFTLLRRQDGRDKKSRHSAWFVFQRMKAEDKGMKLDNNGSQ